jgi:TonB family protein
MFDKLIVSEPDRGEVNHRRNYFLVSTLVVGVLFITGVVISIYAADFSLGTSSFELTELIAPLEMAPAEAEQIRTPASALRSQSVLSTRTENIQDLTESPKIPPSISMVPSNAVARPLDSRFVIGTHNSDPASAGTGGRAASVGGLPGDQGLGTAVPKETEDTTPPPPARVDPPKPTPIKSKGVVNGQAKDLPKPEYSAAARQVNAQGKVDVQVTIDESGRVISAHAVSGHPLLRPAAENAAHRARFSPTLLSETAVKVTGVIVYNFIR